MIWYTVCFFKLWVSWSLFRPHYTTSAGWPKFRNTCINWRNSLKGAVHLSPFIALPCCVSLIHLLILIDLTSSFILRFVSFFVIGILFYHSHWYILRLHSEYNAWFPLHPNINISLSLVNSRERNQKLLRGWISTLFSYADKGKLYWKKISVAMPISILLRVLFFEVDIVHEASCN